MNLFFIKTFVQGKIVPILPFCHVKNVSFLFLAIFEMNKKVPDRSVPKMANPASIDQK